MCEEYQATLVFRVIVSHEQQFSLWLVDREIPPGWFDAGPMRGSAVECLAQIKEQYFRKACLPEVERKLNAKAAYVRDSY